MSTFAYQMPIFFVLYFFANSSPGHKYLPISTRILFLFFLLENYEYRFFATLFVSKNVRFTLR